MAKVRGTGISSVNYPTGMNLGGDPTQALIHMTTTGSFVISLASCDLGQGLKEFGLRLGLHHHLPEMKSNGREFHYNFRNTPADTGLGVVFDDMAPNGDMSTPEAQEESFSLAT